MFINMHEWVRKLIHQARYQAWAAANGARRFSRLLVFGVELVILSKLFSRRRSPAPPEITAALLHTKSIDHFPPELSISGPDDTYGCWSEGFSSVNASLFLNLHNPDGLSPVRYAHPAPSFRAIYLWDSAFISQIWKWWDPDVACDVLRSVIELRDGSRLQHFVAEFTRSKLTQPPLLAWALAELGRTVEESRYREWVGEAYEPLRAYHYWLFAHRQLPNGLFAWAHPYESGVENAPRFSSRDERRLDDTSNLAAPDLCSYMVLQCEALAEMARLAGKDEQAAAHESEAAGLRGAVNDHLWDEEEGLYFDRDVETGEFVRSRTIASLMPLWAGIPDPPRAKRLVEQVLEPNAFNTVIPLPSVALNDESFERDMWRGPVWVNTAFAVIAGLRRYAFHEAAADLAFRLCDGVFRTFGHTGRFHEFYDPSRIGIGHLHRKRGNRWKRITLGSGPVIDFVGWSGLVNTLVVDMLFGLRRTPEGLSIKPCFPARARGLSFSLNLPLHDLNLDLTVGDGGTVRGTARAPGGEHRFKADFGSMVALPAGHAPAEKTPP
jgi:hypothetical protein